MVENRLATKIIILKNVKGKKKYYIVKYFEIKIYNIYKY